MSARWSDNADDRRARRSGAGCLTVLTAFAIVAALLLTAAATPAAASEIQVVNDEDALEAKRVRLERYMRRLINAQRLEHGRGRVRRHDRLTSYALRHSRRQRDAGAAFHSGGLDRLADRAGFDRVLENVGYRAGAYLTHRYQVRWIVEGFMRSPSHRAALLDRRARRVGVGLAWADHAWVDGQTMYATAIFGRP